MAKQRKTGGSKKKTAKPSGKKKISGLMYDPAGCFDTKSAAVKSAETLRAKGKRARVIPKKSGKGACIYTR